MRIFRGLFALACLLTASMVGMVSTALAHALPRHGRDHLHLRPRAPRSILQTRRIGLA
ncbi:hypothetical protein [Sphingomonas sp. PAMC26645]|uniref:hypothetical protein n=1 Tax=Sphingomonas sp. PAMC26645 TaxID=2565555 RepID=UPI001447B2B0|nr:hypothetical protein [Sphingomonas sp. PAMC26645]